LKRRKNRISLGDAECLVGIGGVGVDRQQLPGKRVGVADHAEAFHLVFLNHTGVVGLHAQAQRHRKQGIRIVWIRLQTTPRQALSPHAAFPPDSMRAQHRGEKGIPQFHVRLEGDVAQKSIVVQKEL
jgi:hypothetical protein